VFKKEKEKKGPFSLGGGLEEGEWSFHSNLIFITFVDEKFSTKFFVLSNFVLKYFIN